jgi:hypothetical protein
VKRRTCCCDVTGCTEGDRVGIDDTKHERAAGRLCPALNIPLKPEPGLSGAPRPGRIFVGVCPGHDLVFRGHKTRIGAIMRLPQDIANLLAISIRDVVWYKDRVYDFLKSNQLPPVLLKDTKKLQQEGMPTIKLIHHLFNELDKFGDEGWVTSKRMLTSMYNWKDTYTIEAERKEKAERSLKALRQGCEAYLREIEFKTRQEQEAREKEMHPSADCTWINEGVGSRIVAVVS